MRNLLIDIGNTRLKWCLGHPADDPVYSTPHREIDLAGALAAWRDFTPERVWLASVGPTGVADRVEELVATLWSLALQRVHADDPVPGVRNGYREPRQLGVDRLLAMTAAVARVPPGVPICVVDCGTASTIDFVSPQGEHLGGFILPGIGMMRTCLLQGTGVPPDGAIAEGEMLGRDTPTAMAMAARLAVVGLIEPFLAGPRAFDTTRQATVVLGGGDAGLIAPLLAHPPIEVAHLVLEGLAIVGATRDT